MSDDDRAAEFGPIFLPALQQIRDLWVELKPLVDETAYADLVGQSYTCPDWQQRSPAGGCKHLRRVDHEIKRGRVSQPDSRLPADATNPD